MRQPGIILFVVIIAITSPTWSHRVKRLADVVCSSGTTKVTTPFYFRPNSAGWCGLAVGQLANDYYNIAYRQECQRWLGLSTLPDSVAQAQLTFCYEYPNGTAQYRIGVCCNGNPIGLRCFTGEQSTLYTDYFYSGHWSYKFDYENSLTTCGPNEVCQTKLTFYGSSGSIYNITVAKGCSSASTCAADGTRCQSCVASIPTPTCTSCCSTPFCNYDSLVTYIRPGACPTNPCDSNPCLNGGYCYNDAYNSSLAIYTAYYCRCPPYWGGSKCEAVRSLCENNTCLNGGKCYNYSDVGVGQYRCDCTPPFVGDRCELRSNLTCNASNSNYYSGGLRGDSWSSFYVGSNANCTKFAWAVRNKPELGYYNPLAEAVCPGSAGRAAAVRVDFELATCSAGSVPNIIWDSMQSCCYNVSKCNAGVNPCLNGGTCYDYSTTTPGDNYRCECLPGFVGDNCELKNNLTCSSTSITAVNKPLNAPYLTSSMNCSAAAEYYRGRPQLVPYNFHDFVNFDCVYYTSLWSASGHIFRQGIDGQIASDKFQFELTYCGRNDHVTFLQFRGCCPGCMSSPCLNGGYCLQVDAANYVCKCTFGFNGKRCENRLTICSATGDPHYITFDKKRIDYQGTCKYNLASSNGSMPLNGLPYFNVYARSVNRNNITSVSYPQYVEVVYNGTTVRLLADGSSPSAIPVTALVDGTPVQIPYSSSIFNIYYDGVGVRCDTDFGLSVTFDGTWVMTVSVPATYNGKLDGVCANGDGNPDNDLTTADGLDVRNNANAFNLVGDSYVVPDPEQPELSLCPAPPQPPPCHDLPQNYTTRCGVLNSTSGALAGCVNLLGQGLASHYADMCIMDACYTHGKSICSSIKAFVDYCAFLGGPVQCSSWLSATGCGSADYCPAGMTYNCSVAACLATCTDPRAADSCSQPNKDACMCPAGQLLFNGSCTANCPNGCLVANRQLRLIGTSWPGPNCTTISCQSCQNCTQPALINVTLGCGGNDECVDGTCFAPTTEAPDITMSVIPFTTPQPTPKQPFCNRHNKQICKSLAKNPLVPKKVAICTKIPKCCSKRTLERIALMKQCKQHRYCKPVKRHVCCKETKRYRCCKP